MKFFSGNGELKLMAVLLAIILWLALRLNSDVPLPDLWPAATEGR